MEPKFTFQKPLTELLSQHADICSWNTDCRFKVKASIIDSNLQQTHNGQLCTVKHSHLGKSYCSCLENSIMSHFPMCYVAVIINWNKTNPVPNRMSSLGEIHVALLNSDKLWCIQKLKLAPLCHSVFVCCWSCFCKIKYIYQCTSSLVGMTDLSESITKYRTLLMTLMWEPS